MKREGRKSGGAKKYGRNKKPVNQPTSQYAKGKISFETYKKLLGNS